jgi:hypothetical protein
MALLVRDATWEGAQRRRLAPRLGRGFTAAYGQPELACDTPRLPPERRRATGSPSRLDLPLDHPSGRDPTIPRTAGRTKNGRSPEGSGGGRDSSASCRGCTSSFTCLAWRPTGAIGTPGLYLVHRAATGSGVNGEAPSADIQGWDERRTQRAKIVALLLSGALLAGGEVPGIRASEATLGCPRVRECTRRAFGLAHDCARRTTPRTYSDFASAYSFPSLYRSARVCFRCSYRRASSGWLRR